MALMEFKEGLFCISYSIIVPSLTRVSRRVGWIEAYKLFKIAGGGHTTLLTETLRFYLICCLDTSGSRPPIRLDRHRGCSFKPNSPFSAHPY